MADKEYICIMPCHHEGKLYRKGEKFRGVELPKRIKKDKHGKVIGEEIAHFAEIGTPIPAPTGKAVRVNMQEIVQ